MLGQERDAQARVLLPAASAATSPSGELGAGGGAVTPTRKAGDSLFPEFERAQAPAPAAVDKRRVD
eukprot:6320241-Pyramimonas_sp.AAC.1